LTNNLPVRKMALKAYILRIWIEEMLGIIKNHSIDLKRKNIRYTQKLYQLTANICLIVFLVNLNWC